MSKALLIVRSNYKADAPWEVDLSSHVMLVGRNGKRKSAVVEAVQLALTGQVDGVAGRDGVKAVKTLWRGAPADADNLFAEVETSGHTWRWESTLNKNKTPGQAVHTCDGNAITADTSHVALLVNEIRDNLFGSSSTAAKWLADVIGFDLAKVAQEAKKKLRAKAVAEEGKAIIDSAVKASGVNTPADLLAHVGNALRDAKAQAKTSGAVAVEMEKIQGGMVTDADLHKAEQEVEQATNVVVNTTQAVGTARTLCHEVKQYVHWQAEMAPLVQEVGEVAEYDENTTKLLRAVVGALQAYETAFPGKNVCPCCQTEVGNDRLQEILAVMQGHENRAVKQQMVATGKQEIAAVEAHVLALKGQVNDDLFDRAVNGEDLTGYLDTLVAQAQEARTGTVNRLDELQRRRVAAQGPETARANADAAEAAVEVLKAVQEKVTAAVEATAKAACAGLAEDAAAYTAPEFGTPRLALLGRDVEIGFERNGRVGLASGAEEANLLMGLAGALHARAAVEADAAGAPLGASLLIAEDRQYDDETAQQMVKAFGALQVDGLVTVLTLVHAVKETGDWQVVRCPEDLREKVEEAKPEEKVEEAKPVEEKPEPPPVEAKPEPPPAADLPADPPPKASAVVSLADRLQQLKNI